MGFLRCHTSHKKVGSNSKGDLYVRILRFGVGEIVRVYRVDFFIRFIQGT